MWYVPLYLEAKTIFASKVLSLIVSQVIASEVSFVEDGLYSRRKVPFPHEGSAWNFVQGFDQICHCCFDSSSYLNLCSSWVIGLRNLDFKKFACHWQILTFCSLLKSRKPHCTPFWSA